MARGLATSGFTAPGNIIVTRRNIAPLQPLANEGIGTTSNNLRAIEGAQVVILAVKPKHLDGLLAELGPELAKRDNPVVVSTITGISIAQMTAQLPEGTAVMRAMPNTATAVRESITCIAAGNASEEQTALVCKVFDALGESLVINEELFQAATVLGACGVAYALRFIRAMSQGGIEIGFDAKTAQFIATQTLKGAARILQDTGNHPEHEIDKVTTPQGCTIAGLNEMEHRGFTSSLIKGIGTSFESISEMKEDA